MKYLKILKINRYKIKNVLNNFKNLETKKKSQQKSQSVDWHSQNY